VCGDAWSRGTVRRCMHVSRHPAGHGAVPYKSLGDLLCLLLRAVHCPAGGGAGSLTSQGKLSFEQLARLPPTAQLQIELLEVLVVLAEAPSCDLVLPRYACLACTKEALLSPANQPYHIAMRTASCLANTMVTLPSMVALSLQHPAPVTTCRSWEWLLLTPFLGHAPSWLQANVAVISKAVTEQAYGQLRRSTLKVRLAASVVKCCFMHFIKLTYKQHQRYQHRTMCVNRLRTSGA
jgi:hypothetical protein